MTGLPPGLRIAGLIGRGGFDVEVDLTVPPGQVLALLGPNGAGKTTVLRAVAGLESLRRGRIELAGRLLDDGAARLVPAAGRSVGLVFQDYRLFPHLSVRGNVAFGLRANGAGRHRAARAADHWLHRLGLTELADRRPAELSGGQAQRVAVARALAAEPRALLLDEPLAALDARTRPAVRLSLREHLTGFAGPVVVVTHDPVEAMLLADRLVVLEGGRVVQDGPPDEVARRPVTDFVARLVGLNLLAGRPGPVPGEIVLDDGGTFVGRPAPGADGPAEPGASDLPQRLLVAVRPSAITVHRRPPSTSSARNVWSGVVDGLEPLPDRVRIHVDGPPAVLADLTPDAVRDLDLTRGRQVWLSVKATETDVYPRP
jgi:molybdate transport system ATP-binding protein